MRLRITLAFLLCSLAPITAAGHGQSGDKDLAELRAYTLDMDKVTRVYMGLYEIKQASDKDPNLQKTMSAESGDDKDSQTIASITAKISAIPAAVAIIAKNHFTPHEFVVAELSVIQAGFAAAAVKMGAPRQKLISDGAVSETNLEFAEKHQPELEELAKKYPFQ